MYSYIKGIIADIYSTYIVLENNGIGYKIYTSNPYSFKEEDTYTVYLYQHIREDEISFYGFINTEERDLFLKLIDVKGVGPRMALPMLATGSVNGIIDAIERENILYLTKFPKIGDKVAKQIILDLKGKLVINNQLNNSDINDELGEVLKGLGYKAQDIKKILPKVNSNNTIEEQVKEALKLLLK